MKLHGDYILREVAGEYILISVGATALDNNSLSIMTETGAFLLERIQQGASRQELLAALLDEFEVDEDTASADIDEFLNELRRLEMLEE